MAPLQPTERPLAQRLLWFMALWAGGVVSLALVAYGIRLWIR